MTKPIKPLVSLKKRQEFLYLRKVGETYRLKNCVLQLFLGNARRQNSSLPGVKLNVHKTQEERLSYGNNADARQAFASTQKISFGLVVTKKMGNAVERNFIKRRFRAAMQQIVRQRKIKQSCSIVLLPRTITAKVHFQNLVGDISNVLEKVNVLCVDRAGPSAVNKRPSM